MTAAQGKEERARLGLRAAIVGLGTLASRLLGLARDAALAAVFRAAEADAFLAAFTLPNMLRQMLAEGAVSSAVLPVLSEKLTREGDDAARVFFARMRGLSLVALAIVTLLGVVFARPICLFYAKGYVGQPEQFERTVALTRVVFPYILFMGTAALGAAALHAKRKFAVASFAPGLLNVALLIAVFSLPAVLIPLGIDPTHALSLGALLGGVLQVVAQWPTLARLGFLTRPRFDFGDPAVREVLRRLLPVTLGMGIYSVDLFLSRRFLSELGDGAQLSFYLASRLCDFPQGIFVMAIATASLPSLASLAASGQTREVAKTYAFGMQLSQFVAIPASVALVVLAEPVVTLLFERGQFRAGAVEQTVRALAWQGGAIWTVTAVRQIVPVFHALGDTRTPVVISGLDLVVFIALALGLRGTMGATGISVAVAGSSFAQMVLLLVTLRWRAGISEWKPLLRASLRVALASLVAAALAWLVIRAPLLSSSARAMAALAVFGAVYLGLAALLRFPESEPVFRKIRARFSR